MEEAGGSTATNSTSKSLGPIRVIPISRELVPAYWGLVAPLLQRPIERGAGELTLNAVYDRLLAQYMQLLVAVEGTEILAAFVTEVVNYPNKKSLRVVLCGGERLDDWAEAFHEMMKKGAAAIGAKSIEMYGRAGWVRAMRRFPSIKLKYYVMVEDI